MPILPDSQLFQSFSTEAAQIDLEWPISPNSQLFQIDPEQPILPDSQLFQSFSTEADQSNLEWPISPDSPPGEEHKLVMSNLRI